MTQWRGRIKVVLVCFAGSFTLTVHFLVFLNFCLVVSLKAKVFFYRICGSTITEHSLIFKSHFPEGLALLWATFISPVFISDSLSLTWQALCVYTKAYFYKSENCLNLIVITQSLKQPESDQLAHWFKKYQSTTMSVLEKERPLGNGNLLLLTEL